MFLKLFLESVKNDINDLYSFFISCSFIFSLNFSNFFIIKLYSFSIFSQFCLTNENKLVSILELF